MEENRKNLGMSPIETGGSTSETTTTTTTTDEYPDQDSELEVLKKRVSECWEQCELLYLSIGRDLLKARTFFDKQGKWLDWLKKSVPFSVRQAQRLTRVAEWFGDATPASHLDFTKAYVLTKIPKPKVNDFLKQYQTTDTDAEPLSVIQAMGKRELEEAIREYLKSTSPIPRTRKEEKLRLILQRHCRRIAHWTSFAVWKQRYLDWLRTS